MSLKSESPDGKSRAAKKLTISILFYGMHSLLPAKLRLLLVTSPCSQYVPMFTTCPLFRHSAMRVCAFECMREPHSPVGCSCNFFHETVLCVVSCTIGRERATRALSLSPPSLPPSLPLFSPVAHCISLPLPTLSSSFCCDFPNLAIPPHLQFLASCNRQTAWVPARGLPRTGFRPTSPPKRASRKLFSPEK